MIVKSCSIGGPCLFERVSGTFPVLSAGFPEVEFSHGRWAGFRLSQRQLRPPGVLRIVAPTPRRLPA